jgi:hypothetical protein
MNESHDDRPIARGASLDWAWNWTDWLPAGDTITAQAIAATDALTASAVTAGAGLVSAVITCGADAAVGSRQRATCTITTASGLIDSRTIRLVVAAR